MHYQLYTSTEYRIVQVQQYDVNDGKVVDSISTLQHVPTNDTPLPATGW